MEPSSELIECLTKFRCEVNAHPRIKGILKGWSPRIQFETMDSGAMIHSMIENQALGEMLPGGSEHEEVILIRAKERDLIDIFSGRKNPARAFLDAELEIFGNDKDRVKLDAISLVLWGV